MIVLADYDEYSSSLYPPDSFQCLKSLREFDHGKEIIPQNTTY